MITVSLISLNDNNRQAVRIGVMFKLMSLSQSSKVFRGLTTPHCIFGSFQKFRTFPQVPVFETMWLELRKNVTIQKQ